MPNPYTHTDNDGDSLQVDQGHLSVIFSSRDGDTGEVVEVAVRKAELPALITTLQAMHEELSS